MKVLQSYNDWLLLNKGEIKPEVDDIITYHNNNEKVEIRLTNVSNQKIMRGRVVNHSIKELINARASNLDIKDCYVEIDYNPNEAIEFAEWINSKMEWNFNNEYKTIKELYKQFKDE